MIGLENLVDCWRYGYFTNKIKLFQWFLRTLIILSASYFLFIEKDFFGKLLTGESVLVDVLLGLPLLIALLVVLDIIILGIVKTVVCLFGWVSMPENKDQE